MFALPPRRLTSMALPDNPPADLHTRPLSLIRFAAPLWRSHSTGNHPIYFGRSGKHRWDAPNGAYGILYVADSLEGAFAEGYLTDPSMHRLIKVGGDFVVPISSGDLDACAISKISVTRPLRLVDLRGDGVFHIGADASLVTGPHSISKNWGVAIFTHPDNPDGIIWRSRVTNDVVSLALHERAESAIKCVPDVAISAPANRDKLNRIIRRFRLAIIP